MATISSLGIGSGLDLNGMLTKLMAVESQPLTALDTQEASYQAKISALGSLKGSLSSLQSALSSFTLGIGQTSTTKFASYTANVADSSVATATAGTGAVAGNYSLHVTTAAKSHQTRSGVYSSSTAAVSTGTIVIERGSVAGGVGSGGAFTDKTGTGPITVTIDSTNNTLAGVATAINNANAGVSATIVSGTSGAYLMLTSNSTGTQDAMKITGTIADFAYDPSTNTGNMTQTQAATDASLTINSVPITSTSNTIANAITGVTLTLKDTATTPADTTLSVSQDKSSSLVAAFNALAKAYNDFSGSAHAMSSYDANTKKAGILLGNSTLLTVQSQLTRVLGSVPSGASGTYTRLAQIGVTLQKDGTMAVDTTKLQAAISNDFNSVASLATSLGTTLNTSLNGLVGSGGLFDSATDGLNASVKSVDAQRTQLQKRLSDIEARYRAQFSALDTTIAQMNSTSTYLTQQLSALAKTA
ncbi:MAG TPA: flagellar filament capping protein FliD [Rhodocyclaceae bacterium]